jgi:hypothetical protein
LYKTVKDTFVETRPALSFLERHIGDSFIKKIPPKNNPGFRLQNYAGPLLAFDIAAPL